MAEIQLSKVFAAFPVEIAAGQKPAFATAARLMSFGRLAEGPHARYILALRDVSLHLKDGHRIGLMGRNGSGKSTLLRMIGGIFVPSSGFCRVNGTLGCVLSTGAGMDVDKTGRQNLRMISQLQGLYGRELEEAMRDAIDFCELGPFIDLPVRTYSSGMISRLTFAIATARRADIMLIDEVIGAGDAAFVDKASGRVRDMCSSSGISLVASHSDKILRDFAETGLWMNQGQIAAFGPIDDVIQEYTRFLLSIGDI